MGSIGSAGSSLRSVGGRRTAAPAGACKTARHGRLRRRPCGATPANVGPAIAGQARVCEDANRSASHLVPWRAARAWVEAAFDVAGRRVNQVVEDPVGLLQDQRSRRLLAGPWLRWISKSKAHALRRTGGAASTPLRLAPSCRQDPASTGRREPVENRSAACNFAERTGSKIASRNILRTEVDCG
jgi:hypothetical protein